MQECTYIVLQCSLIHKSLIFFINRSTNVENAPSKFDLLFTAPLGKKKLPSTSVSPHPNAISQTPIVLTALFNTPRVQKYIFSHKCVRILIGA